MGHPQTYGDAQACWRMPAVCGQARILSAGSHHSRQPACFQNSNVIRRGPRGHSLLVLASQKGTKSKRARQPPAPSQQLQPSSSELGTADEVSINQVGDLTRPSTAEAH